MKGKAGPKVALGALLVDLLLSGTVALAAACGSSAPSSTLTVAAATDLQAVFGEVGRLFQAESGIRVTFTFGSSGLLATQIQQGAPFDVFASADVQFIDRLRQGGHVIADTQTTYAVGRLALATSRDDIHTLDDLLRPQVRHVAIANPEHAPYGRAAAEALRTAGLWQRLADKIVFGENVGQAFQFVRSGQAEAGLVALSLAVGEGVNYAVVDNRLHRPLIQAAAVVVGTDREGEARRFVAFLRGSQAQQALARYGFLPPEE